MKEMGKGKDRRKRDAAEGNGSEILSSISTGISSAR